MAVEDGCSRDKEDGSTRTSGDAPSIANRGHIFLYSSDEKHFTIPLTYLSHSFQESSSVCPKKSLVSQAMGLTLCLVMPHSCGGSSPCFAVRRLKMWRGLCSYPFLVANFQCLLHLCNKMIIYSA